MLGADAIASSETHTFMPQLIDTGMLDAHRCIPDHPLVPQ